MRRLITRPAPMKLVLVMVAMTQGCNGDVTPIETPEDPCLDQGCSGHGQCAVVVGDTAVCICDVGYHSEGLSCVENVVGEECSGVTCSGHGTCVVVRGDPDYPFCVCDQGYRNAGDTNCMEGGGLACGPGTHEQNGQCVPDPVSGCGDPPSCPDGTYCDAVANECVPVGPDTCGYPQENGEVHLGGACDPNSTLPSELCMNGLVCVADRLYGFATHLPHFCAHGCDPCDVHCPFGEGCAVLEGGRGVCASRLCYPNEPCEDGVCVGGVFNLFNDDCMDEVILCEPDWTNCDNCDPPTLARKSACESDDCPAGTVCINNAAGGSGPYECGFAKTIDSGHSIPNPESNWPWVDKRARCRGCDMPRTLTLSTTIYMVCTQGYRCNEPNDPQHVPCSPGTECFGPFYDSDKYVCIANGGLMLGSPCLEDLNCEPGLFCLPDPFFETGKSCRL